MTSILSNWNFMRFLRLGMGLWLVYSAIFEGQWIFGLLGAFFAFQAIMNVGCACGTGNCVLPSEKRNVTNSENEISYEEVR